MSFELAAIVVVGALAIVLGLTCYHLLGRLEMLERAVHGGLQAPTRRLSREQFERRFVVAHARSKLAAETGTGIVLVVGAELEPDTELARTLDHLSRTDRVTVTTTAELSDSAEALGVTTTPYLFVIDDCHVRTGQPVVSVDDVERILNEFT